MFELAVQGYVSGAAGVTPVSSQFLERSSGLKEAVFSSSFIYIFRNISLGIFAHFAVNQGVTSFPRRDGNSSSLQGTAMFKVPVELVNESNLRASEEHRYLLTG